MTISEVTQLGGLFTSMVSVVVSIFALRRIGEVKHLTNSMKDQLVASVSEAEHAKGVLVGRADVKAEEGAEALAVKKAGAEGPRT